MRRIAIRCDSSVVIGGGHVARCTALAAELARRGAMPFFITRDWSGNPIASLREQGFSVFSVQPSSSDFELSAPEQAFSETEMLSDATQTVRILESQGGVDWVIVDHYSLGATWDTVVRSVERKLLVIDDLANRAHDCDVLVDQGLYALPDKRYQSLVSDGARMLVGPGYAMVNRPGTLTSRPQRSGGRPRCFVFFGSADTQGVTKRTLPILDSLRSIDFDVLVGGMNPRADDIAQAAFNLANISFHKAAPARELVSRCDMALVSASMIIWELALFKVGAIALATAENQRPLGHGLMDRGAALYLGNSALASDQNIRSALEQLGSDRKTRERLGGVLGDLCDGRGLERIADILLDWV